MRTITAKTILVLNFAPRLSQIGPRNGHRYNFGRRFGLRWFSKVQVNRLRVAPEVQRIIPEAIDVAGLIGTEHS
jgi:hypothetical protein